MAAARHVGDQDRAMIEVGNVHEQLLMKAKDKLYEACSDTESLRRFGERRQRRVLGGAAGPAPRGNTEGKSAHFGDGVSPGVIDGRIGFEIVIVLGGLFDEGAGLIHGSAAM